MYLVEKLRARITRAAYWRHLREVAAKWPDATLRAEGRTFALLDELPGSILQRAVAAGTAATACEREELQEELQRRDC